MPVVYCSLLFVTLFCVLFCYFTFGCLLCLFGCLGLLFVWFVKLLLLCLFVVDGFFVWFCMVGRICRGLTYFCFGVSLTIWCLIVFDVVWVRCYLVMFLRFVALFA